MEKVARNFNFFKLLYKKRLIVTISLFVLSCYKFLRKDIHKFQIRVSKGFL
jgi:hypothetical protein